MIKATRHKGQATGEFLELTANTLKLKNYGG